MKTKTFLFSVFLIILFTISLKSFAQQKVNTYLDEFIIDYMFEKHIAGMSAVIVIGDSVVWKNHYGFAKVEGDSLRVTDSTLFNLYSISKLITAVCVMQCWENDLLDLDENINNFLPFSVDNYHTESDSTTARMIMTHSSGIRDYHWSDHTIEGGDPTMSLNYIMENYLSEEGEFYHYNNFLNFTPGEEFEYTNFGIALNGLITEVLTGEDYKDYSKDSLFTPLGMDQTGWMLNDIDTSNLAAGYYYAFNRYNRYPRGGHPAYPGVSGRSTSLELSNLLIMLMNEGKYQGIELLKPNTIDTMSTVFLSDEGYEVGLGMFKMESNGRTIWGHNGGGTNGFANHFFMCPENNTGVVITTNSNHYPTPVLDELFDYASLLTSLTDFSENQELEVLNYPNPFITSTTIQYTINSPQAVTITFYNQFGKVVNRIEQKQSAGKQQVVWSPELPGGVYYFRLEAGEHIASGKIILTK